MKTREFKPRKSVSKFKRWFAPVGFALLMSCQTMPAPNYAPVEKDRTSEASDISKDRDIDVQFDPETRERFRKFLVDYLTKKSPYYKVYRALEKYLEILKSDVSLVESGSIKKADDPKVLREIRTRELKLKRLVKKIRRRVNYLERKARRLKRKYGSMSPVELFKHLGPQLGKECGCATSLFGYYFTIYHNTYKSDAKEKMDYYYSIKRKCTKLPPSIILSQQYFVPNYEKYTRVSPSVCLKVGFNAFNTYLMYMDETNILHGDPVYVRLFNEYMKIKREIAELKKPAYEDFDSYNKLKYLIRRVDILWGKRRVINDIKDTLKDSLDYYEKNILSDPDSVYEYIERVREGFKEKAEKEARSTIRERGGPSDFEYERTLFIKWIRSGESDVPEKDYTEELLGIGSHRIRKTRRRRW